MKNKNLFSTLIILALLLSSCATIVNGTTQQICFTSIPSQATIIIDNCRMGQTPIAVDLARSDNHFVHIELEGYQPLDMHITKRLSLWVFGNIVFGNLIGVAVDAVSGGIYKLTPEQIHVHLAATGQPPISEDSGYVNVVLTPDPSWEKIDQMTPCQN